jgi:hypothetical protein
MPAASIPEQRATKPLGGRSYGSIGHLPGSRLGPGDHSVNPGQERICLERYRDRHDRVTVTEKVDGSNVSVARVGGVLVPLIRAGYPAVSSHWPQHRMFAAWAFERLDRFEFLRDGERLCGEWLAQAHGTRYALAHEPFVAFDLIRGAMDRATHAEFRDRAGAAGFTPAKLLHDGGPLPLAEALDLLGDYGHHGAADAAEGVVYRVERKGRFDYLAKYVRPGKVDGKYLPELNGGDAVWNWRPGEGA